MSAVAPSQMTLVNLSCLFHQFGNSQASIYDGSSMGHVSSSENSLALSPGATEERGVL